MTRIYSLITIENLIFVKFVLTGRIIFKVVVELR